MTMDLSTSAPELRNQIFLGGCDIAGAGAQAIISFCLATGALPVPFHVDGFDALQPVFQECGPKEIDLPLLILFNLPTASFLVINAAIPKKRSCAFAHLLLSFITSHAPQNFATSGNLNIVAALRIQHDLQTKGLHVHQMHGGSKLDCMKQLEAVPGLMPINDALISAILHFSSILEVPASFVCTSGFKPSTLAEASQISSSALELRQLIEGCIDGKSGGSSDCHLTVRTMWHEGQGVLEGESIMYL